MMMNRKKMMTTRMKKISSRRQIRWRRPTGWLRGCQREEVQVQSLQLRRKLRLLQTKTRMKALNLMMMISHS